MWPQALAEGRRQAYLAALDIPLWRVRSDSVLVGQSIPIDFVPYYEEQHLSSSLEVESVQAQTVVEDTSSSNTTAYVDNINKENRAEPIFDEPPLESYFNDPEYQRAEDVDNFARARESLKQQLEPVKKPVLAADTPIPAVNDEQPIHFKFAVYTCGLWQLIVPRSQLLSPSEMNLLANIQRVLQTENAPPLLFAWPMVNHYAIPRHKTAAREALKAFFSNQALSDKGYIVLPDYEDELFTLLQQSTTKPVIRQLGLSSLLQHPIKKKDLWLALTQ
ncbi:MAG: hypothetical protein KDI00_02115 [Pseudomonadales bacterium]|nr:hypothetical protein [Pseudomonadales bacterium]